MAALTGVRYVNVADGKLKKTTFPLLAGAKAWEGGACGFDTGAFGGVKQMAVSATLQAIGWFLGSYDNTAGGASVAIGVELYREHDISWWDSVTGGGAITTANLFQLVYWASDHELTTVATGASVAGRVWQVGVGGYPGAVGIEFPY